MSTTTKNYNFILPSLSDSPPDITATNSNWETADQKLKTHESQINESANIISTLNEKVEDLDATKIRISETTANLYGVDNVDEAINELGIIIQKKDCPLQSYNAWAANANANSIVASLSPGFPGEFDNRWLGLGYQAEKFIDDFIGIDGSGNLLTADERSIMRACNDMYQLYRNAGNILERFGFFSKFSTCKFIDYIKVTANFNMSIKDWIDNVNLITSKKFSTVAEIKADVNTMNVVMQNKILSKTYIYNSDLEIQLFNAAKIFITQSASGYWTCPINGVVNYVIVSAGLGAGTIQQGRIKAGSFLGVQGQSYNYTTGKTAGQNSTLNSFTTAGASQINDDNTSILLRCADGKNAVLESDTNQAGGGGGGGGYGAAGGTIGNGNANVEANLGKGGAGGVGFGGGGGGGGGARTYNSGTGTGGPGGGVPICIPKTLAFGNYGNYQYTGGVANNGGGSGGQDKPGGAGTGSLANESNRVITDAVLKRNIYRNFYTNTTLLEQAAIVAAAYGGANGGGSQGYAGGKGAGVTTPGAAATAGIPAPGIVIIFW